MADISKITLPNKSSYNLKDTTARTAVSSLRTNVAKTVIVVYADVSYSLTANGADQVVFNTSGGTLAGAAGDETLSNITISDYEYLFPISFTTQTSSVMCYSCIRDGTKAVANLKNISGSAVGGTFRFALLYRKKITKS